MAALPEEVYALVAANPNTVLLETSRFDSANQRSLLFLHPVRILSVNELREIPQLFTDIERARQAGLYVAGFFSYECGLSFEKINSKLFKPLQLPLAWFGVYDQPFVFDHGQGGFVGMNPIRSAPVQSASIHAAAPNVTESDKKECCSESEYLPAAEGFEPSAVPIRFGIEQEEYCARIGQIKELIAAGDTYQVNFTDAVRFETQSTPSTVYQSLLKSQSVAYGAWLNIGKIGERGAQQILSFSPELFFCIDPQPEGRKITTRPMKGTLPRGLDTTGDVQAALRLANDEKNRSEHVMIVDLLRNDLGRICETGSIQVEDLFSVERYQTLLQMTSTVSGLLRPEVCTSDIFRSLFPSGSVTGAPKIHTMQIINELERTPRGIYTGAIGFIAPDGESVFNVAIRTLVMKDGHVQMGIGGGIVADSDPLDEYQECLLKASFLSRAPHKFQLIETMLWAKEYRFLAMHLDRMESSASYFDLFFDRPAVLAQLSELAELFRTENTYRVRLLLNTNAELSVEFSQFHTDASMLTVNISKVHTVSTDLFLRHKTTQRELYEQQYAAARANGLDEVIFTNEKGEVTEGAISNLFVQRDGKLLTPPLSCGVLPGVYRRHLLETRTDAQEHRLMIEDVKNADAVFLCNALRGLREVKILDI